MNEWSLIYEGFDPDGEGIREALCTLGNGYFATRGAGEETSAKPIRVAFKDKEFELKHGETREISAESEGGPC